MVKNIWFTNRKVALKSVSGKKNERRKKIVVRQNHSLLSESKMRSTHINNKKERILAPRILFVSRTS